jgi:hypothetical protein
VIAVNVVVEQDDLVQPFLAEHRYTFTAYKVNDDIRKAYEVRGAPMEFLIDPKGGAVMMLRLSSEDREQRLGEIIEQLLKESGK